MQLELIQDHLAASTDLVTGLDLFVYDVIDDPSRRETVLIVPETSRSFVDHEVPGRYEFDFQIIVRNDDYVAAIRRANEIFSLLESRGRGVPLVFPDWIFEYVRARHLPIPYRRSDAGAIEVSMNFSTLLRKA